MKIAVESWLLAAAYVAWGLWLWHALPKSLQIFAGSSVSVPAFALLTFQAGRTVCFSLALALGLLIVLKDKKCPTPLLNPLFGLLLVGWTGLTVFFVFLPAAALLRR